MWLFYFFLIQIYIWTVLTLPPCFIASHLGFRFRRKEMFYLMTHSTHFIYGYMALEIW